MRRIGAALLSSGRMTRKSCFLPVVKPFRLQLGTMSTTAEVDESFNKTFLYCNPQSLVNDAKNDDMRRIIVFYDGGCDICLREINHYNSLNQTPEECLIAFFDLCSIPGVHPILARHCVDPSEPFRRVHVLTEHGEVLTSTKAFCEVWSRLPYWRLIVPIIRHVPGVIQLSDFIYGSIADIRLKYWPSTIETFKEMDRDGDGKLCKEEVRTVLEKLGESAVSEDKIVEVMTKADVDGDGYLTYEEFLHYFYAKTANTPHPGRSANTSSSSRLRDADRSRATAVEV